MDRPEEIWSIWKICKHRVTVAILGFMFLHSKAIDPLQIGAGFLTSYNLYYTFGARRSGEKSFGMIIINSAIHIHHWQYCCMILSGLIVTGTSTPLLIGLCWGGIMHGIQFDDWFKFLNN